MGGIPSHHVGTSRGRILFASGPGKTEKPVTVGHRHPVCPCSMIRQFRPLLRVRRPGNSILIVHLARIYPLLVSIIKYSQPRTGSRRRLRTVERSTGIRPWGVPGCDDYGPARRQSGPSLHVHQLPVPLMGTQRTARENRRIARETRNGGDRGDPGDGGCIR